eukprot:scaffold5980_cov145-Isochrysis_galbana.AAC.1
MKVGDRKAVKVGEVVVDPLLPRLIVSTEVRRQPLHRVEEARHAPCEPRGTARGRPSICTSVTVIGLNLAAPI